MMSLQHLTRLAALVLTFASPLFAGPRPHGAGFDGWLAVEFDAGVQRVLVDVHVDGSSIVGTERTVPVDVWARAACAATPCRAGTRLHLGAVIAGGTYVLRTPEVTIRRGQTPTTIVRAPVQLEDAAGGALASGVATMFVARERSSSPARGAGPWRYQPTRVVYQLGDGAPPIPPGPPVTPPPTDGTRVAAGALTSGVIDAPIPAFFDRVAFDLVGPDFHLTGLHTEPGGIVVRSQCWDLCTPGREVNLGMTMIADYAGTGDVTIRGETVTDVGLSSGFTITAGDAVIPFGDDPVITLRASFRIAGRYWVALGADRRLEGAWGRVDFTGHGTATMVLEAQCIQIYDAASGEVRSEWRYVPRRLTYVIEP